MRRINLLNIALMLLSCGLAYVVPLQLFLFSYVVLGPLHYLTELSWLHKRQYFIRGRDAQLVMGALCVVIFLGLFLEIGPDTPVLMGIGFGCAFALVVFQDVRRRVGLVLLVALGSVALSVWPVYGAIVLLLPTAIHVYVFTGFFILYGALKSRSRSAYLSLAVFLGCGAIYFFVHPVLHGITANPDARASFESFESVNYYLARILGATPKQALNTYGTGTALVVMRFMAFAYTYHYLNWFSKTSIIGWHEVPRQRLLTVVVLWAAFVAAYVLDFSSGLTLLRVLSGFHVLLEFPLDHQTMLGVGREFTKLASSRLRVQEELSPT
jgi:hypothetical protein